MWRRRSRYTSSLKPGWSASSSPPYSSTLDANSSRSVILRGNHGTVRGRAPRRVGGIADPGSSARCDDVRAPTAVPRAPARTRAAERTVRIDGVAARAQDASLLDHGLDGVQDLGDNLLVRAKVDEKVVVPVLGRGRARLDAAQVDAERPNGREDRVERAHLSGVTRRAGRRTGVVSMMRFDNTPSSSPVRVRDPRGKRPRSCVCSSPRARWCARLSP